MHINVCVYICIYVHIHVCSEFWNFWTIPIDRATTTTNHMLFVTNPKLQRQTIEHHILLHTTGVEHRGGKEKREPKRILKEMEREQRDGHIMHTFQSHPCDIGWRFANVDFGSCSKSEMSER